MAAARRLCTAGCCILPWLLASLMLEGCVFGPEFRRPAPPPGGYPLPSQSGTTQLQQGAQVAADWYALFRCQALNQLVQEALRNNADLEAARHSLRAAQYELQAVAGSALPQLNVDGKVTRARVNGSLLYEPDEKLQVTANQFTLGPSLAYDTDIFGRIRRAIESQAAQAASTRAQTLNVYVTLVDQVVLTAFDYAAQLQQIAVTRALVAELQQQYNLTRLLEDAGKIVRSETLQAQSQLESTRAQLPALEKQRDVYRNALLRLQGHTPGDYDLPQLALDDFALPAQLPVSLPSDLVRQRPDILEAEELLHAASAGIGVARAARFPSFSISAQYAQQSIQTSDLFGSAATIWTAGVNMTAPLFAGGTLLAREHEAQERYRQAAAQYRSTVLGAFGEVTNALQALQHDADSYAAHAVALEAARANRELARQQFERGRVNELVVLTAQQQYQNAALSSVQADVQRFADAAELFRALGGGWWNAPDPSALPAGPSAGDPGQ